MEPTTAASAGQAQRDDAGVETTGSRTIADMLPLAARLYAERTAARVKRDGAWHDVTFAELGATVSEIARGLIDIGVQPGERVCILAATRPEWTYADLAIAEAGGVKVPIYPTNSPEECEWVAKDSEAVAIVCDNAEQLRKIDQVRANLPHLRQLIVIDEDGDIGDAITLAELRARGTAHGEAELEERYSAVRPEDPYTFIYTSGTTGPPKGCVLSHGNYRRVLDMCRAADSRGSGDVVYLFLPLAHAFALLIQLLSVDGGGTIAYWGGDVQQILPELREVQPDYFPSVPRIFEKIYALATDAIDSAPSEERQRYVRALEVGLQVREMMVRGEPVPEDLQREFDDGEKLLYSRVREIFGGRMRQAVTGAAPIAPKILEFFYACGIPVLEGYGMTETATVATVSTIEDHRFGTVGRPLPGCEVRIASDGEILIRGDNIFGGYHGNADASFGAIEAGWLHTGDLGSTDEDGYLTITGRKKDIIITAGGKNLTPANLENDMKQLRWVSQAVMHGDRRPYPVMLITLDEEEIVAWAQERGLPTTLRELARSAEVHELIAAELESANAKYARVEQVKKFVLLDHDLTQEGGELTPTLKVKRDVVNRKYAHLFDALYEQSRES